MASDGQRPPEGYDPNFNAVEALDQQRQKLRDVLFEIATFVAESEKGDPSHIPGLVEGHHVLRAVDLLIEAGRSAAEQLGAASDSPQDDSEDRAGKQELLLQIVDQLPKITCALGLSLPNDPKLVFISYAVNDGEKIAQEIRDDLLEEGLSPFLAPDSINGGEQWESAIMRNLQRCCVVAALVTRGFLSSEWCRHEVGIAEGLQKNVLFACRDVQPSDLPEPWRKYQTMMIDTANEQKAVVQRIRQLCLDEKRK